MDSILKNTAKGLLIGTLFLTTACGDDDNATPDFAVPATYSFERNGQTTVDFSGQTTRIQMAEELAAAMLDFDKTETNLLEMFSNETADGGDANPFSNADLNTSTKSIRSKVAASNDFFSANTVDAAEIKSTFDSWIEQQVSNFADFQTQSATPGNSGQIADGTSVRYVNDFGIETNQVLAKSLIGALMTDQMLNNYLSPAVLDAADNIANNDTETVEDGTNYTSMEHKWDEAYGYLYGMAADVASPNATIGSDDNFLNEYVGKVDEDTDFAGVADDIFNAFKTGRAAIVAGDYDERDVQAQIIREKISTVLAVRAVYYLQLGKTNATASPVNTGGAFHALSEALGFIYSLQFTRQPNSTEPYFTKTEVDEYFGNLLSGIDGLWGVDVQDLDDVSEAIATRLNFSVADAN